jgi:hypothetical protein
VRGKSATRGEVKALFLLCFAMALVLAFAKPIDHYRVTAGFIHPADRRPPGEEAMHRAGNLHDPRKPAAARKRMTAPSSETLQAPDVPDGGPAGKK